MIATRCPRLWEIEALRDGRLGGLARADAERHGEHCLECAGEARRLAEIARVVRDGAPASVDALTLRRIRNRVLAASDGAARGATRSLPRTPLLVACAIGALGVLGVFGALRGRPTSAHGPRPAPLFVATPAGTTVWSSRTDAVAEHVRLDAGVLHLAITSHVGDLPLVVEVPDGVIEDRGTTFTVEVRDGATFAIDVAEGEVQFRRFGAAAVDLHAGSKWRASLASVRPALAAVAPSITSGVAPTASSAPPVRPSLMSGPTRSAGRATSPSSTGLASSAASVAERDATVAEDAAYLRVLALLREGRREEAKLAAREYLARFPEGFRRAELTSVAR